MQPARHSPIIAPDASADALDAVAGGPRILTGAAATLAAIFRYFGGAYYERYGAEASDEQRRVLQLLALCRTQSLGFSQWECEACGHVQQTYNPCRDRHCAQCRGHLARQWAEARLAEVLPLPYQHLIFTVPHELHVLLSVWENRRVVYSLCLRAARDALLQVAATSLGVRLGMAAILHTWNQRQLQHLHVHTVWAGGGWRIQEPDRFVTVAAATLDQAQLMRVFRTSLLAAICRAAERGRLVLAGDAALLNDGRVFGAWIEQLNKRRWVVLPQRPLDHPQVTLGYLARYTRRVAIDNRRIRMLDLDAGTVTFGYRKNNAGPDGEDVRDTTTIDAVEFIQRYLEHVMPKWFGRTRFYGWWSGSKKGQELPRIRAALGVPLEQEQQEETEPAPREDAALLDKLDQVRRLPCPRCHERSLGRVLQVPMPRLYQLMRITIWPQQKQTPREIQRLLPAMESWLPGGDAFMASLYAQVPLAPTSGFT